MRNLLVLLTFVILLTNCNSSPVEKPKDLIDKDVMVDILYDLYIANAMNSSDTRYLKDLNLTPAKYVYNKYKVDSLQFSRSDRYYATDVDEYENMYKRLTTKIQNEKAAIDAIIAKNPTPEVKSSLDTGKLRDSLRKKRALRSEINLDSLRN